LAALPDVLVRFMREVVAGYLYEDLARKVCAVFLQAGRYDELL